MPPRHDYRAAAPLGPRIGTWAHLSFALTSQGAATARHDIQVAATAAAFAAHVTTQGSLLCTFVHSSSIMKLVCPIRPLAVPQRSARSWAGTRQKPARVLS